MNLVQYLIANPPRFWQDLAKTIPAEEGDPVAVMETFGAGDLVQPDPARRPKRFGAAVIGTTSDLPFTIVSPVRPEADPCHVVEPDPS